MLAAIRKIRAIVRNRRYIHHLMDKGLHDSNVISRWPAFVHSLPSKFDFSMDANIALGDGSAVLPFSEIVVTTPDKFSKVPGSLTIGTGTYIGSHANIRAAGGAIQIGDKVMIAQNVSLIASNHGMSPTTPYIDQPWDEERTGVIVENDAWVGCGAVLLPGVKIGRGAIIAAGAVVNKSVPPFELWGGVPARRIRVIGDPR